MKFTEILEFLLQGEKIRRADWVDGDYIFIEEKEDLIEDQDGYGYTLSRDDFNAEWGIYKEPLLTEEEKEILKAMIKFSSCEITEFYVRALHRNSEPIKNIVAMSKNDDNVSTICVNDNYFKNLKGGEIYTLEELGL